MRHYIKYYTATAFAFLLLIVAAPAFAQFGGGSDQTYTAGGGTNTLVNPLNVGSLCSLLKEMLDVLLIFGVPIAVLFLTYSGFLFVKARGNPKELLRARKNFTYVILGIMLFLGAWTLGQIVASTINTLGAGSGSSGAGVCR